MNALVLDRDDIDLAAASWAIYAYTIADIDAFLPRGSAEDAGPVVAM